MRHTLFAAILGLSALLLGAPRADAALSYQNGDLFLGFRASGGDGASQDYLVKIGPASQFTSAAGTITVPGLGNIASDLARIFGTNWSTRDDLFWSISGGNLPADPENTLYATKAAPGVGVQPLPWLGNSNSAQGVTLSRFNALAGAYVRGAAAAGSPVGTVQNAADANSYASFQPGGTVENANGQSFAAFSPTIEANFANGANSVLDLIRVLPNYQQYGQDLGSFTLTSAGVLTFTPAPSVATVRFENSLVSVNEDSAAGRAFVTLQRGGKLSTSFTVLLSTANGSGSGGAQAGIDYTAQSNVVVAFDPFELQTTVEIPVAVRAGVQGNRSFSVNLTSPSGGTTLATPSSASVSILESETVGGKLNFAVSSYQKAEGAAADVTLTISVTRGNGQTGAASVQIARTGGTATSATDFTLPGSPVTLSWAANDVAPKTFDLTIKKDDLNDDTETVVLALQNPTGAVLGTQATTTVAIFDGTPIQAGTVNFTTTTYAQTENPTTNAVVLVSATRSGGKSNAVTVQVAGTGGTATLGTDYTLLSPATISWAAGEDGPKTLAVTVKPDVFNEGSETAQLTLQSPTGSLAIGAQNTATLTITDAPDSVAPTLTLLTPKANAKVSGPSVTLTGVAKDDLSVGKVEVSVNNGPFQSTVPSVPAAGFNYSLSVIPEQGLNTVFVRSFDAAGNVSAAPITRSFTFSNVRPLLAGVYSGLLVAGSDPYNNSGFVTVTVAAAGTFTGKVSLSNVVVPIKGTFATGGQAFFNITTKTTTFELTKKVGTVVTSLGHLSLQLDTGAGHKITGVLKTDTTTQGQTLASTTANLGIYSAKKPAPAPFQNVPLTLLDPLGNKGKFTVVFQARSGTNNGVSPAGYPQGDGYSTLTVSAAGLATFVGKLADGQVVSFANPITTGNHVPFFVPLYVKKGFITGDVVFDTTQAQSDAASALRWFKPASTVATDKNYPAGWINGIGVDLFASKFIVPVKPTVKVPQPPNPDTVLGAGLPAAPDTTTANILITLADGSLPASTVDDGSISGASKVTIVTNPSHAKTLKVTFAPTTGSLTGSFIHPGTNKAVTFAGVAYQKTNTASGYFLYTPPATQTGATIQSGAVGVGEK